MSKQIDDGGPAYPSFTDKLVVDPKAMQLNCITYGGMTLRDWFAGQALGGMMADPTSGPTESSGGVVGSDGQTYGASGYYALIAESCYEIADAMLAARKATT